MAAMEPADTHANSNDRSVVVLKTSDVTIRGNDVFMPITIEMSQIKKPERGQFKKIKISKEMTEREVTDELLEKFPYLRNQRFYCAAAVDNRSRLDFHGGRRIWNGRLIKRFLKGNSALYIFVDEQVSGYANMAPPLEASTWTALTTGTQIREALDAKLAHNMTSPHFLPIDSRVRGENLFVTQPAQNALCSSLRDSQDPVTSQKSTTKRPHGEITFPENEPSNQVIKKLRASKDVPNDAGSNVPCDTDARTPHRSLGTATAKERVYEQSNHSFQREGQLQELSGRHVEVKGFAHENTQYDPKSPIRHQNPAIQETRIATGPTPSYFTPRTVPVGNVPSIEYPMRQDNNWSILSNATSTILPQSNNGNQTFMVGDSSKNDRHTPFPACSDSSTSISLSNSSKQFFHVDKQVVPPKCLTDTHNSNSGCWPDTNQGAQMVAATHLSDHESSVVVMSSECKVSGPAAEVEIPASSSSKLAKQSPTVSHAGERCVNISTKGQQEGLETPESDYESQLSDSSVLRPTDSGNETSTSLGVSDGPLMLKVSIVPERVPYWEGGNFCRFDFEPRTLPSWVKSGSATFGNLGTVELKRLDDSLIGRNIPAREAPGIENVTVKSNSGDPLGGTLIEYYDGLEEMMDLVVKNPLLHASFFFKMGLQAQANCGDAQNSTGSVTTQPLEVLKLAVYAAAKCGAMQFIKTIFSSKAGRAIFIACKENSPLPEVFARKHGHDEVANYLEGVTARFSKDSMIITQGSQNIHWQELISLAKAVEEKEEQSISCGKENYQTEGDSTIDPGYLGDTEPSLSTTSSPSSFYTENEDLEISFEEDEKADQRDFADSGLVAKQTKRKTCHEQNVSLVDNKMTTGEEQACARTHVSEVYWPEATVYVIFSPQLEVNISHNHQLKANKKSSFPQGIQNFIDEEYFHSTTQFSFNIQHVKMASQGWNRFN